MIDLRTLEGIFTFLNLVSLFKLSTHKAVGAQLAQGLYSVESTLYRKKLYSKEKWKKMNFEKFKERDESHGVSTWFTFFYQTAEKHNCEFIKNSITENLIENSSHSGILKQCGFLARFGDD